MSGASSASLRAAFNSTRLALVAVHQGAGMADQESVRIAQHAMLPFSRHRREAGMGAGDALDASRAAGLQLGTGISREIATRLAACR
ncbi:MAG: hypothetical protein U5L98_02100 [Halomonas sp.]|uniref:hypothetical protein n=1 Tax=Halomonas sp. TaxID=1486246 RepID=UPI002ACDCBC3|nr:hypothetical protein [Halomonas sp.]MDZ7851457.1 hypothetical protein [Halomonas sp.]